MSMEPSPNRIKRLGVVMEMADGTTVALYAESPAVAEVTLVSERPEPANWWGGQVVREYPAMVHGVHVDGLGAYTMVVHDPATAQVQLDTIQNQVEQ